MDAPIIAFDESGNTGPRLLEKGQPVFVLSSVRLTQAQAQELYRQIKSAREELKFSQLQRKVNKGNLAVQEQVLNLINHDLISEDTVRCFILHKDYSIWAQITDKLIEPVVYDIGEDLYKNGGNLMMTNMFFYFSELYLEPAVCDDLKAAFIKLFKEQSSGSILTFYSIVRHIIHTCKNEDFAGFFHLIAGSEEKIDKIFEHFDSQSFDTTLSGFVLMIDYWGRKTKEKFDVTIDPSKALEHFKDYIEAIKKIDIKEQLIGSDRRTYQVPFKLENIIPTDSKNSIEVQIADIIAGAASYYYRALALGTLDDFAEKIGESKLVKLHHDRVWPHQAFSPEALDTVDDGKPNALDAMTSLIINSKTNL